MPLAAHIIQEREDRMRRSLIAYGLREIAEFRDRGILHRGATMTPVFRPVFTYALICINDALQHAALDGKRIGTKGPDVWPVGAEEDLTSLIAAARNAACHIATRQQRIGLTSLRYMVSVGPDCAGRIGGVDLVNPHDGEVAVFFGELRIYLERNLFCAMDAARVLYPE